MKSRIALALLSTSAILAMLSGCGDPLSVDTPRRIIPVNIDSILLSDPFLSKPGDTLFALVNGVPVAFNSELLRPVFYNRHISEEGAWYISVQGARYDLKGEEYESLSLRLDGVKDIGTFPMNGEYVLPKRVDTNVPSKYVGKYEQRGTSTRTYTTTTSSQASGEIRVVGIDVVRGVMVGTFTFTGRADAGNTVRIENGIFRLRLNVQ